jgi:alanyl-tRNA synthetase
MKTASEIRQAFLDFFRERGHEVVASSSLVPQNDPTLMFTNAGMVQFKDVFVGKETRAYKRATSSQKCIRISGKHNDLENVGVTARHHTFFEMLGNFSFGDYFKEDAIVYAWELLTKVYGLSPEKMCVTIFRGDDATPADDEARALWKKVTGYPDEKIIGLGAKDNFWQMGDTGPCGPCTEIHYWNGEGPPDFEKFMDEPPPDGSGWMEIWNLVFMQFDRDASGTLTKLPAPCVDTGMGLERLSSVLQGKRSNYDCDLLRALVDEAAKISGKTYGGALAPDDISMRVIADHARTTAFLIAEGVFPDRAGREYVLRRVMRRAIRHGHRLGIREPFLHKVALDVVRLMGEQYPELIKRRDLIASVTEQEEVRFRETIERGLGLIDEWQAQKQNQMPGDVAFKLYDTYGFPLDLTDVIAHERGFEIDKPGFDRAMEEQKKKSSGSKVGDEAVEAVWHDAVKKAPNGVRFTGYERDEDEGTILAVVRLPSDRIGIITDVTPFYGEAGGQVGDAGVIAGEGFRILVEDTQKPLTGLIAHIGKIEMGSPSEGVKVRLAVYADRRNATRRNHSATHLLHWALRSVLGESATQKGSLVGPDRLRFDYASSRPLSSDEIRKIEDLVNEKILLNAPVETRVMTMDEAKKTGAMAIFEEKYGDVVRVLTMTKDSVELCGGTHARRLGDIGMFKILSDGGIAAGVRRIEAATGKNALGYVRKLEETLGASAQALKSAPSELKEKIEKTIEHEKKLEKEIADLKRKLAMGGSAPAQVEARDIPGGKALSIRAEVVDAATLRELAEKMRDKLGDAVVLVGAADDSKAMLVLTVSKSLTDRYKAGELIRPIAQMLGGSGGGRPDMAQAGGTQVDKLDEALASLYTRLA